MEVVALTRDSKRLLFRKVGANYAGIAKDLYYNYGAFKLKGLDQRLRRYSLEENATIPLDIFDALLEKENLNSKIVYMKYSVNKKSLLRPDLDNAIENLNKARSYRDQIRRSKLPDFNQKILYDDANPVKYMFKAGIALLGMSKFGSRIHMTDSSIRKYALIGSNQLETYNLRDFFQIFGSIENYKVSSLPGRLSEPFRKVKTIDEMIEVLKTSRSTRLLPEVYAELQNSPNGKSLPELKNKFRFPDRSLKVLLDMGLLEFFENLHFGKKCFHYRSLNTISTSDLRKLQKRHGRMHQNQYI